MRWRTGKTNNNGQVIVVGRAMRVMFTLHKAQESVEVEGYRIRGTNLSKTIMSPCGETTKIRQ